MKIEKAPNMDFKLLIAISILIPSFIGSAAAQSMAEQQDFTQDEIIEMANKAVVIVTQSGTFTIELFPEVAPNHVYHFLKLIESGYYDGTVFHRIIPGFMIQGGDPNTKDYEAINCIPYSEWNTVLDSDVVCPDSRKLWGMGGPDYRIGEEFNNVKHNRGILSMARSADPNSAGSQFFIVHQNSNFLDGQYTVFGRLIPQHTGSFKTLDNITNLATDEKNKPIDISRAIILETAIISHTPSAVPADMVESQITDLEIAGGVTKTYTNAEHKISFDLPYRWTLYEISRTDVSFALGMEPDATNHAVARAIAESGFTPQVMVFADERNPNLQDHELSGEVSYFSIREGDTPEVLGNFLFQNEDGRFGQIMVSSQKVIDAQGTHEFKILQMFFANSGTNYSVIYLNVADYFAHEVTAFTQVIQNFEIVIDGVKKPINFHTTPVFRQVIEDSKLQKISEPPLEIGGCLIVTASYGSELAPQVQQLRELRDNTVLQTESGSSFMSGFNHLYYSFSPTIADYERENPVFREAVKLAITPLLTSLTLLQYVNIDSEQEMLIYGAGVILLNIGMYFVAPAILITKIRSFYKLQ